MLLLGLRAHLRRRWTSTKAAIDRPRPAGPLVDTSGPSFPSGHAAYSTVVGRRGGGAHAPIAALPSQAAFITRRAGARGGHRPVARLPARALLVGRGRRLGARRRRSSGCWPRSRWSSRTFATMSREPPATPRARLMNLDLTTTEITIALASRLWSSRLRRPDPHARLALLRAAVGEARGELPDALHPRHAPRNRRGDRARGGLELRPVRVDGRLGEWAVTGYHRGHVGLAQPASATAEPRSFLDALEEVSEAVEAGAGLPQVARAAGRALDASVIVLDAAEQRARRGVRVARGRARGAWRARATPSASS